VIDAEAVNIAKRLVLWDNGLTTSMTNLYALGGDETDDPSEAVFAVAPLPHGEGWASIDLTCFADARTH
jgi:hypothetical protein